MQKRKYFLLIFVCLNSFWLLSAQSPAKVKVSLTELFEIAEKNNRTLKIGDYAERIAAEQIKEEQKKLLPSLDASLSVNYLGDAWISDRNFSKGMTVPVPHFGNNFAVEATQIIYAGGAIKNSIEMAKLNQVLAQLDKDKNRQDIRFVITGYYLELLKLNNQEKILEQNIVQTNKLLEQITVKQKQGTTLKNNKTRYELQLQSLELVLLKLVNSKTIINNELMKIVQLPTGTILEADAALLSNEVKLVDDHSLLEIAIESSPLIKQLQVQAEQSLHRETLAKSEKLPQVFAFAGDKLDGPITVEIPNINQNLNYWYVGVGIKYNIASLYKKNTKIKQAKLATQSVLENAGLVRDQLTTDINAAYLRYLETLKVYKTQLKGVDLANENYTVTRNRYVNDLVLITEMLDAENAKLDAELQAANAQINILFHYYQLKKLTGTL